MKDFVRYPQSKSPVDVNGVHVAIAELGDLEVVLFDILLVVEVSPAVGGNSSSISHIDEVDCVALQFKPCHALLILTNPSLAKVDDVCPQQGGVNAEVSHVRLKSGNIQSSHPHFANREPIPFPRVVVQGSGDFSCQDKISHQLISWDIESTNISRNKICEMKL